MTSGVTGYELLAASHCGNDSACDKNRREGESRKLSNNKNKACKTFMPMSTLASISRFRQRFHKENLHNIFDKYETYQCQQNNMAFEKTMLSHERIIIGPGWKRNTLVL
jgi:hypothetical protein